jgi:hypothetical protein
LDVFRLSQRLALEVMPEELKVETGSDHLVIER